MAVALLIVQGPYVGQQIPVGAGQTFRIGRTERSEYAFPNDTYLSSAHFEVSCNEGECRIRDLGSSNGTFVNGAKVDVVAVREGDQVSAGETVFLVQAAAEVQMAAAAAPVVTPSAGAPVVAAERTARMFAPGFEPKPQQQPAPLSAERKRALHILTRQGPALFTVLDASRDGIVKDLLQSSRLRYMPLFDGDAAEQVAPHIPALVELGQGGASGVGTEAQAFLEALLRSGWGRAWGIFCTSAAPLDEVWTHFRSFLLVRTKEQRPLYFRFYDARVLRAFLPTCEPQELNAIFGPIASYLVESDRPDTLLAFSSGTDGLITARVSLTEPPVQAQAGSNAS
jgi:hypothetical protein